MTEKQQFRMEISLGIGLVILGMLIVFYPFIAKFTGFSMVVLGIAYSISLWLSE